MTDNPKRGWKELAEYLLKYIKKYDGNLWIAILELIEALSYQPNPVYNITRLRLIFDSMWRVKKFIEKLLEDSTPPQIAPSSRMGSSTNTIDAE